MTKIIKYDIIINIVEIIEKTLKKEIVMKKFFLVLFIIVINSSCATNATAIKNWIGDAGSPVSREPLFQVYTWSPKPVYYNHYRAGDNDYNYYENHYDKKMPAPPQKNHNYSGITEGRESVYYYGTLSK